MREIALDHLSFFELPPSAQVRLAAEAGYRWVGLFLQPIPFEGSAQFDMAPGGAEFRETRAALAATGLRVSALDPFLVLPNPDFDDLERKLELGALLETRAANVVVLDPDAARQTDTLARLAERAAAHGVPLLIEAYPLSEIRTQAAALALADRVSPAIGFTVDSLHIRRAGQDWSAVAALPLNRIGYLQLSDGPLAPPADLTYESVYERGTPGEGEFDLAALIPLIPETVLIAIEAPSQRLRAQGLSPIERARHLMARTSRILT